MLMLIFRQTVLATELQSGAMYVGKNLTSSGTMEFDSCQAEHQGKASLLRAICYWTEGLNGCPSCKWRFLEVVPFGLLITSIKPVGACTSTIALPNQEVWTQHLCRLCAHYSFSESAARESQVRHISQEA